MSSLVLLGVLLTACGGGGGSSSVDAAAAGAAPTATAPVVAASGASDASAAAADAAASASAASAADASADDPGVDDAVGTVRILSSSATWSLGLPRAAAALVLAAGAGRRFYVDSANGQDTRDGRAAGATATSGPWRTLARLLQSDIGAGDTVELACGSVWHETLRLPAGGASASQPVTVRQPAAGCTVPPTIDGAAVLAPTAWTAWRGNIFKASLDAAPLQLVSSAGVMTVAHHPNRSAASTDPNSPWLALAAESAGNVLTTGSDLGLPPGATLGANARVRVRTNPYIIDEAAVTAYDGTHLTLAQAPTYTVSKGWGYLLVGELWMLDSAGEWFYDAAAKQLYAWMPDSSTPSSAVAVTTLATGIDLQGRSHIVVDGLALRNTGLGVDLRSTSDVTVRNLQIQDIADVGIDAAGSTGDVVDSNRVTRTGGDAITGWGGAMSPLLADSNGLTVRNNVVRDSAVAMLGEQVLSVPRRSLAAIFIGSNSVASGNTIVNAAYIGILSQNSDMVSDNFIYGACSVLDDCGAIYTGGDYNHSQILRNTVVHSRGALAGQPLGARNTSAQGIYIDDQGADILVQDNTVVDTDNGIQLHNAARITVSGNALYGNRRSQLWIQENTNQRSPGGDVTANVVTGNQFAAISANAVGMLLTTVYTDTAAFGTFTANRFYDRASSVVAYGASATASRSFDFAGWRGSTGVGAVAPVDLQGAATSLQGYTAYSIGGANLVPNAALATNAAGWSSWNATLPAGQAIREACPAGVCLRYVAGGSTGILSSPGFSLQQGAWYRLSIDVSTPNDGQTVPLVVRVGSGDYASVSDRALGFAGTRAWGRHDVVFQAMRTVSGAGARIDIDGVDTGQSVSIANAELVPITPSLLAAVSTVIANPRSTPLVATCPLTGTQAPLCASLFSLADAKPVSWPATLAPHASLILYSQDASLRDSDNDGIPDAQDRCPGSSAGAAVDAAGCELSAH